jgi:cytidine kinase
MSILISGTVALDSIHTPAEAHNDLLGGSASYAGLAAALSAPVELCSIVGKDFPAEHSALLTGKGIGLGNVEFAEGRTFRWTGRYHENMNHRETLDVSIDVLEKFAPQLTAGAAAARVLLLANMSPDNQLAVLDQTTGHPFVIADSMDLWINIARDGLRKVMARADLFVINEDEARMFTEASNLVTAGWRLMEMGPKHVVVKKGEHGALLFGPDGQFFATPAYPLTHVADPTGAGDSFAGGLAGHVASLGRAPSFSDLAAGVVRGSVIASFTCESFGVKRLAAVTADEAAARLDSFRRCTAW